MPFNGSGNFTRLMNWVADAASGTKIRADRHDIEDDNLAAGLSMCLTKDGQQLPTANIPMNGKRIVNLADPVNPQDALTKNYLEANAFTIAGNDLQGRLNFTGSQTDPTGAAGRLGISFSQSNLFFGVRRLVTGSPATQAAFVWHDNSAGTGNPIMRLRGTDGMLSIQNSLNALAGSTGNGQQLAAMAESETNGAGGLVAVRGNGSVVPSDEKMAVAIYTGSSSQQGGTGANLWGRAALFDAGKNLTLVGGLYLPSVIQASAAAAFTIAANSQAIFLRPNTVNSATGQAYLTTAGQWVASGYVASEVGIFRSNTNVALLSSQGGTIYLRPNGDGSPSSQATLAAADGFFNANYFRSLAGGIYSRDGDGDGSSYFFTENNAGSVTGYFYYSASTGLNMQHINGGYARIDAAGNFVVSSKGYQPGGGSWGTTSDARMKTVDGAYAAGLAELRQLNPVRYRYNDPSYADPDKEYIGLVAQDVEAVMPEMVSQTRGEIAGQPVEDLRALDNSALIYAAVNAIKELADRVDTLEAA